MALQAAYGFLGDVMVFSEGLRFMGPSRYDLSGFLQFLRLKSYKLHIKYQPALQVGTGQSMAGAPKYEWHCLRPLFTVPQAAHRASGGAVGEP